MTTLAVWVIKKGQDSIRTAKKIKKNFYISENKIWSNVRVKDHAKEVLEELKNI